MNHLQRATCLAVAVCTMLLSACSKDDNNTIPAPSIQLVNNSTYGNLLTDSAGNTLYFFSVDVSGQSGCSGNCAVTWPVFYSAAPSLSTGLAAADFATITRGDGSLQTTYRGWPLYYYKDDQKAGETNGEGINGVWFVAKPDYTIMIGRGQLTGNDGQHYTSDYQAGDGTTTWFTDSLGRTLYAFAPDRFNSNTYTKEDFSNNDFWPIFERGGIGSLPSNLTRSDFAVIDVFGKKQLTYKGWPLYYFGPDNATRGNTKGVSVPTPGKWPVVNTQSPLAPQ